MRWSRRNSRLLEVFGWLGLEGAQSFACLTLMEEEGLWPDGLLDAMIPKSLVLIGSGVQLDLESWFRYCHSRFSVLVGNTVLLRPGIPLPWTLRNHCLVSWILMYTSLQLMLSNPLIWWTGGFWTASSVVWGCLVGFVMPILSTMPMLGCASSFPVGLDRHGPGMGGFLRVALSA